VTVLFGSAPAIATMPNLSPRPDNPSVLTCKEWAALQDDDALEMWGLQEDGTHSRTVAIGRLIASCMGQPVPDIVGFGSSAAFNAAYCAKHPTIKFCIASNLTENLLGAQSSEVHEEPARSKAASARSLEQTAAFILTGGDVEVSSMTVNADGSVTTPAYALPEAIFQGVPLIMFPAARYAAIDRENCVVEGTSAGTAPIYRSQPQKKIWTYFNKITGFNEQKVSVPMNGSLAVRIKIFATSEEPYICASGGGIELGGRPLPQQRTCYFTDQALAGVRPEKLERVENAIHYLYSAYCKLATKKNPF
jgi:hypothetical protein